MVPGVHLSAQELSIGIYLCTAADAAADLVEGRLVPSPRTVVVTPAPQDWTQRLRNLSCEVRAERSFNGLHRLHRPSHIRIVERRKFDAYLQTGRKIDQLYIEDVQLDAFDEHSLNRSISRIAELSLSLQANVALSIVLSHDRTLHEIEAALWDLGLDACDLMACWLVSSGNRSVRYLRCAANGVYRNSFQHSQQSAPSALPARRGEGHQSRSLFKGGM